MEKINERQLLFARNSRLRLLFMALLCILFFICSMTTINTASAITASSGSVFSFHSKYDLSTLQQDVVKGTVTDASTGEPLIGVTVVIKGTTLGTLTDIKGQFTLRMPERQGLLTISFIGYTTQELSVTQGSNISVSMQLAVTQIQEVVVVGYGVQKKESVVGAITQVNSATLMRAGISTVTNAIAGQLSGVLTIQNTGEPGADASEIIVRGLSSWNGSAPLVLVDGIERDFKNIDPNEINTISVLKDASATAVFGAKGANGVIIVTTKRGTLGKPKMDFTALYGVERATRIPDHISSYTTMSLLNVAKMNQQLFSTLTPQSDLEEYRNPSSPLKALQFPNVNWFDEVTNPFASDVNANFNIQGGTKFVKYFGSLGYSHQGDLFKGLHQGYQDTRYKYNRFNYRANVDFTLTKLTMLSLNLGGDIGIKNQPQTFTWRDLYNTGPSRFPAYFPAWVLEQVPDPYYPDAKGDRLVYSFGELYANPYTTLNNGLFNQYTSSKLFTDFILDQKLDFVIKGLSFKGKFSLSTYFNDNSLGTSTVQPQYKLDYSLIGVPGKNPWYRNGEGNETYTVPPLALYVGSLQSDYYTNMYYEFALNYSNSFGKHNVTALALMNRQQQNIVVDFPFYNEGFVGRATYDFSHKYLLEVNIGYTGSERFAPGNRFGFFPSGAVGWVISEEEFFKNALPWMNKLKLRYSDGLVGSDYASSRWLYNSDYFKDAGGYIREDKGANVSAQWEEARKRDIGIEIGILKDMFTLNVDLFDEQRTKMLLTPQSVTFLVANTFKDLNLGSLKKHGIEVEAEFNKTTSNNIHYFVKGIFGFNENRVIFKDDPIYAPDYIKQAGKPLGGMLTGIKTVGTGYFTSINDIHTAPAPITVSTLNVGDYKFLDYTGDGIITSTDRYPIKGSDYPPITYSLSSGFSYKGFDFNFLFQGNSGKYVNYNAGYELEFLYYNWRVHSSALDYWTPTNPDANHATLHYTVNNPANFGWLGGDLGVGYTGLIEGRYWRNADYLRLKEIYVGYTFNPEFLKRLAGVSSMSVYATGNNLWTITRLIEGDPERKDFNTGFYPQMTTLKLGLKFGF